MRQRATRHQPELCTFFEALRYSWWLSGGIHLDVDLELPWQWTSWTR